MDARTKRSVNYLIRSLSGLDDESLLSTFREAETTSPKFAAACLLMACGSNERYADTGPVQVGIVGGEVMEFGKQRGVTQIPF